MGREIYINEPQRILKEEDLRIGGCEIHQRLRIHLTFICRCMRILNFHIQLPSFHNGLLWIFYTIDNFLRKIKKTTHKQLPTT